MNRKLTEVPGKGPNTPIRLYCLTLKLQLVDSGGQVFGCTRFKSHPANTRGAIDPGSTALIGISPQLVQGRLEPLGPDIHRLLGILPLGIGAQITVYTLADAL